MVFESTTFRPLTPAHRSSDAVSPPTSYQCFHGCESRLLLPVTSVKLRQYRLAGGNSESHLCRKSNPSRSAACQVAVPSRLTPPTEPHWLTGLEWRASRVSTKQTPSVTFAETHSLPHTVQRHSSETQSYTAYRLIAFSWPPALCCKDAAAVVTLVRTKGEKAELVFQFNSICV